MHPLCVGLGWWTSRYHTKDREAPGLLTPPISPLGHKPEMVGQGQTHSHTWGPGEDPLQLGKESQGTHSPSREIRHTPWDWSLEKALSTRYRVNQKTEQSQAHHQADEQQVTEEHHRQSPGGAERHTIGGPAQR